METIKTLQETECSVKNSTTNSIEYYKLFFIVIVTVLLLKSHLLIFEGGVLMGYTD